MQNKTRRVHLSDPIVALATPHTPSALAIIRTSGEQCITVLAALFSRPQALQEAAGNTLIYGWIQEAHNPHKRIDEVMLALYRAPKSYTGEDMVEIMCHGGTAVVQAILSLLLQNGFRQAERGEFTLRSFINGKSDLTKAEAVSEIISAKTDESRSHAVDRLSGSVYAEIDRIKKLVIRAEAAIAVEIEYPEDEEHFASENDFDTALIQQAIQALEQLSATWAAEKIYREGIKVVLCGRTNAGKSSLFNALLKEDRSIVSDIHGTTRDWIESWASFDGIPVRLFDTAGLRETDDSIEMAGLERTELLAGEADIVLYIIDAAQGVTDEDTVFLAHCAHTPTIVVWNKSDTVPNEQKPHRQSEEKCLISAKQATGIVELMARIKSVLHLTKAENARGSLGSQRQKHCCMEAHESLTHALNAASNAYPLDAVCQDLEDALISLGEITGEVSGDDILHAVFSEFCVGK